MKLVNHLYMYRCCLIWSNISCIKLWSNHVGLIIGHNGEDFLVAEAVFPSQPSLRYPVLLNALLTTLCYKAIRRRANRTTKTTNVEQVPSRLRKLYHTGFKYESRASSVQNLSLIFIKRHYVFRG